MARYDLGLSELEFWHSTDRQLKALISRNEAHKERGYLLAAIVASTTANFSMSRPKEPYTVADFMPARGKRQSEERSEDEISEDLARRLAYSVSSTVH